MSALPANSTTSSQVEIEARDWFVRLLDTDVPREDLIAWSQWLERDPEHQRAYDRVAELWASMGEAAVERPSATALGLDPYDPVQPVAEFARRRRRLPFKLAASVAGALVLAGGAMLLLRLTDEPARDLATRRAQHLDATLSDGSEVKLGAMTSMRVDYSLQRRNLELASGEALFQVAHDRSRPFVVDTPLAAVTAVGTAFNIDVTPEGVVLDVAEGVVTVAPGLAGARQQGPAGPIRIAAGERLKMIRAGGSIQLIQDRSSGALTWLEGRLEYRNEPLRAVVEDVNRYATQPIVIADEALADMPYTGTVQIDSADNWALGLPGAFPLTVEMDPRGQMVLREKSKRKIPLQRPRTS